MANTTNTTAKKKRATGPRQNKPLYLIVRGDVTPDILEVTKDPLKIVQHMSSGENVKFVDLSGYLPKKAAKADASA